LSWRARCWRAALRSEASVRLHQVKNAFVQRLPARLDASGTWMEVSGSQSERISVMGTTWAMRARPSILPAMSPRMRCFLNGQFAFRGRRDRAPHRHESVFSRIQVVLPTDSSITRTRLSAAAPPGPRQKPVPLSVVPNRPTSRCGCHSTNLGCGFSTLSNFFESRNRLIFIAPFAHAVGFIPWLEEAQQLFAGMG